MSIVSKLPDSIQTLGYTASQFVDACTVEKRVKAGDAICIDGLGSSSVIVPCSHTIMGHFIFGKNTNYAITVAFLHLVSLKIDTRAFSSMLQVGALKNSVKFSNNTAIVNCTKVSYITHYLNMSYDNLYYREISVVLLKDLPNSLVDSVAEYVSPCETNEESDKSSMTDGNHEPKTMAVDSQPHDDDRSRGWPYIV